MSAWVGRRSLGRVPGAGGPDRVLPRGTVVDHEIAVCLHHQVEAPVGRPGPWAPGQPLPGRQSVSTAAAGRVHRYVVDDHRYPGLGRTGRTAAERAREPAADRYVENEEEPMVRGVVPGGRVDLVGVDREEVVAVQEPAQLLGRDAAVVLQGVGVEAGLASAAGPLTAAQSGCL